MRQVTSYTFTNKGHLKMSSSTLSSSANDQGSERSSRKRKDENEEPKDEEETSTLKKPRVVWTMELHQQFVAAVKLLGIDRAVPLRILELMNVPELTRESVASHLQKYRMYLRKLCGISQNVFQRGPNQCFRTSAEAVNGLDLLALASSGQLPVESLASLHAAAFTKSATSSAISDPLVEKRNRSSFRTKTSRVRNGQQGTSDANKQLVGWNQGIPTNMEAREVGNFHSAQQFWGSQVNQSISPLMQMTQLQSSGQLLNQNVGGQVNGFESANGLLLLSNAIPEVWTPNDVERGPVPQGPSMVDFSMNQSMLSPGPSFPLPSHSGVTTLTPNPVPDLSSWRTPGPGYDHFTEVYFKKLPDLCTQSVGSTSHASQPKATQGARAAKPMAGQGTRAQPKATQGARAQPKKGGGRSKTVSLGQVNPALASTSRSHENPTDPGYQSLESSIDDDMMRVLLEQMQQQDEVTPGDNLGYNGYF